MSSTYQGMYYYAKGCEPIESKRPYYIWMIGNKDLLGRLNKKVALTTIQHGYDNYVAFLQQLMCLRYCNFIKETHD